MSQPYESCDILSVGQQDINYNLYENNYYSLPLNGSDYDLGSKNLINVGTIEATTWTNVFYEDQQVFLNRGATGASAGVISDWAGISIERPSMTSYHIGFWESDDTMKLGASGAEQTIATRDDNLTDTQLIKWDNSNKKLVDASNTDAQVSGAVAKTDQITINSNTLNISGNSTIDQDVSTSGGPTFAGIVSQTTGTQLDLKYDGSKNATFGVNDAGDLIITPSGNDTVFTSKIWLTSDNNSYASEPFGDWQKNGSLFIGDRSTPGKRLALGYDEGNDTAVIQSIHSATIAKPVLLNPSGGNVGVGATTHPTKFSVLSTTEQLRLEYDDSNYCSFTTGSTGDLTITPSGGDNSFTGSLAVSGSITQSNGNLNPIGASGFCLSQRDTYYGQNRLSATRVYSSSDYSTLAITNLNPAGQWYCNYSLFILCFHLKPPYPNENYTIKVNRTHAMTVSLYVNNTYIGSTDSLATGEYSLGTVNNWQADDKHPCVFFISTSTPSVGGSSNGIDFTITYESSSQSKTAIPVNNYMYYNTELLEESFQDYAMCSGFKIANTTGSTSTTTGALQVKGGAGIVENLFVGGTLNATGLSTLGGGCSVTGALDSDSLSLPTGATVTAILDEDAMGSDSDTALATQQSIKAYTDSKTGSNITATGALNSGSIATGFGNIDIGTSTLAAGATTLSAATTQLTVAYDPTNKTTFTTDAVGNMTIEPSSGGLVVTGAVALLSGTSINEFSTDGTLAGNSDNACPTEKAVKTYVDTHAGSTSANLDTISEATGGAGVTIDGTKIKDGWLYSTGGYDVIDLTASGSYDVGMRNLTLSYGVKSSLLSYEGRATAWENLDIGYNGTFTLKNSEFNRLSSVNPYNIQGFTADTVCRIHKCINVGTETITIKNNDSSASDANKILTTTGADIALTANQGIECVYDTETSRWRAWNL